MTSPYPVGAMTPERATRLRALARRLEQLELVTLVRSSTADTWTGPTATAVTEMLGRQRRDVLHAVDALRAAARRAEQQVLQ